MYFSQKEVLFAAFMQHTSHIISDVAHSFLKSRSETRHYNYNTWDIILGETGHLYNAVSIYVRIVYVEAAMYVGLYLKSKKNLRV